MDAVRRQTYETYGALRSVCMHVDICVHRFTVYMYLYIWYNSEMANLEWYLIERKTKKGLNPQLVHEPNSELNRHKISAQNFSPFRSIQFDQVERVGKGSSQFFRQSDFFQVRFGVDGAETTALYDKRPPTTTRGRRTFLQ